jgi:hypothetical protein
MGQPAERKTRAVFLRAVSLASRLRGVTYERLVFRLADDIEIVDPAIADAID